MLILASLLFAGISPLLTSGAAKSVQLAVGELCLGLPALIYVRYRRGSFIKFFRLKPVNLNVLLACTVLGLAVPILNDELDRIFSGVMALPADQENLLTSFLKAGSWYDWIFLVAGVVLIAGFAEEMLFRGLLQQALERRWDYVRAITLSALVFAMIHPSPWFAQVMLIGGLLGYIAWRTDSVFPGIVLHGLNNAFALLLVNDKGLGSMSWYEWYGHVHPTVIAVAACLCFYGFSWFLKATPLKDPVS